MQKKESIRNILKYYSSDHLPLLDVFYIQTRARITPYLEILNQLINQNCEILDYGCGYGFISLFLLNNSPYRKIDVIDIDKKKTKYIKQYIAPKIDRLTVLEINTIASSIKKYDFILFIEVAYYLNNDKYEKILSQMDKLLKDNGKIIIINIVKDNINKSHLYAHIQEFITTKITRRTKYDSITFRSKEEDIKVFSKIDFRVKEIISLPKSLLYKHLIYIIEKNENNRRTFSYRISER